MFQSNMFQSKNKPYQKWFEKGNDIYDEEYANHPKSEWLTEVSTSSMMPATTAASQPD